MMPEYISVPYQFCHAHFVQAQISPNSYLADDGNFTQFKNFSFAIETEIGDNDLRIIWTGMVKFSQKAKLTSDEIMNLNFEDLNPNIGILIANAPKDNNKQLDMAFEMKRDYTFSKRADSKCVHGKFSTYWGTDEDFTHVLLSSFTNWAGGLWRVIPNITLAKNASFNEVNFITGFEYPGMKIGFGKMKHEDDTEETLIIDDEFRPHVLPLSIFDTNEYSYSIDENGKILKNFKEVNPR